MEAEVKADMTRWLYGYVNATYQDLRDVRKYEQNTIVANPTKGSRMPNIPYLMANAGLEFHKENLFGGSGMNTRIFSMLHLWKNICTTSNKANSSSIAYLEPSRAI